MDLPLDDVFYIEKLHSERAKLLASEISNETARKILKTLYKNPASIIDISNKLDIPASTVQYHVNRLVELGVIKIAQKRLGKRLRDVKMYIYDKEGTIFLSSMEKRDFMDLVKKYTLYTLRVNVPDFLLISAIFGLILAFVGSLIIKDNDKKQNRCFCRYGKWCWWYRFKLCACYYTWNILIRYCNQSSTTLTGN